MSEDLLNSTATYYKIVEDDENPVDLLAYALFKGEVHSSFEDAENSTEEERAKVEYKHRLLKNDRKIDSLKEKADQILEETIDWVITAHKNEIYEAYFQSDEDFINRRLEKYIKVTENNITRGLSEVRKFKWKHFGREVLEHALVIPISTIILYFLFYLLCLLLPIGTDGFKLLVSKFLLPSDYKIERIKESKSPNS